MSYIQFTLCYNDEVMYVDFHDNSNPDGDTILTPGGMMPSDMYEINPYLRDSFYLFFVLLVVTLVGASLSRLGFNDTTVISVFLLGILGVSVASESQIFGILATFFSFLIFNFLFAEPIHSFRINDKGYLITFGIVSFTFFFINNQLARFKEHTKKSADIAIHAEQERLRSTLLRSISHDLRTPLTTISGNASILLDNSAVLDDTKKNELYTAIYNDSLWLNSLVENLLSITRIEDGKMDLNLQTELLTEVINEALEHIAIKPNQHVIRVDVTDDLLMASMDLRLILQVLINIVENAIKYTPPEAEIVVTAKSCGQKVIVEIADNGNGIDDDKKVRVFDMFYSEGNGCGDNRRGLGLGLALCKAILTAHGEKIYMRDNVPHGTVFGFTLKAVEVNYCE